MAALFSAKWMEQYAKAWNGDAQIVNGLSAIQFDSNIGYGFIGDPQPAGVLIVKGGKVIQAGAYQQQPLSWDLRASLDSWKEWIEKGFGLTRLGVAVATGKLKFLTGDYRRMLHTPSMAGPFLRSFELMQEVKTEFKIG